MSILRTILFFVIAWLAIRIVRSFMNYRRSSGPDGAEGTSGSGARGAQEPENFPPEQIRDAEFEDLTPPENPPEPPKSS